MLDGNEKEERERKKRESESRYIYIYIHKDDREIMHWWLTDMSSDYSNVIYICIHTYINILEYSNWWHRTTMCLIHLYIYYNYTILLFLFIYIRIEKKKTYTYTWQVPLQFCIELVFLCKTYATIWDIIMNS